MNGTTTTKSARGDEKKSARVRVSDETLVSRRRLLRLLRFPPSHRRHDRRGDVAHERHGHGVPELVPGAFRVRLERLRETHQPRRFARRLIWQMALRNLRQANMTACYL